MKEYFLGFACLITVTSQAGIKQEFMLDGLHFVKNGAIVFTCGFVAAKILTYRESLNNQKALHANNHPSKPAGKNGSLLHEYFTTYSGYMELIPKLITYNMMIYGALATLLGIGKTTMGAILPQAILKNLSKLLYQNQNQVIAIVPLFSPL